MPKDIQFPEVEPRYVFERDCLGFRAIANGKPVECLISSELLSSRFGGKGFSEEAMRQAFHEHRPDILAMARDQIENGWIDEEGRVILTTRHTRLTVTFDKLLAKDVQVDVAHRMLLGMIGPQAGELIIEWHSSPETPPNPAIHLHIKDPVIRREISTSFTQKVWADLSALRVHLALTWSALLSARSRDLVLKSG